MTDRYDAVVSRKDKGGKWRSTRIGAAFPSENGRINIVLSALPLTGTDGQAQITLFPAEVKDNQSQGSAPRGNDALDDQIPFGPEFR